MGRFCYRQYWSSFEARRNLNHLGSASGFGNHLESTVSLVTPGESSGPWHERPQMTHSDDPIREMPGLDPLLTARESAGVLQISVPTFWRRVADKTVPKPIKLGGLSRWPRSEILAVIERAKAARHAA